MSVKSALKCRYLRLEAVSCRLGGRGLVPVRCMNVLFLSIHYLQMSCEGTIMTLHWGEVTLGRSDIPLEHKTVGTWS